MSELPEQALPQHTGRFQLLIEDESGPEPITLMAVDGTISYQSPAVEHYFGYQTDELVGTNIFAYMHPDDEAAIRGLLTHGLKSPGSQHSVPSRFRHHDGTWREVKATPHVSNELGVEGSIMSLQPQQAPINQADFSITSRHYGLHDPLTNLPDRTLFFYLLQQALVTAHHKNKPFGLLLLGLNHFREINCTFGYRWGDVLLQQVGTRLRGTLRKSDIIARLGGDEFSILLLTAGDLKGAIRVACRMLSILEQPFFIEGHPIHIGASIGITLYPEHGSDADALMRRADIAMFMAKRAYSEYAVYAAEQDRYSPDQMTLMSELRSAIENDQLMLCYQPKVNCQTGRVSDVEALVRWKHPEHGILPPDTFIPFAEKTGLIKPLSLWVLNAALRQCQKWHQQGLPLRVAINLSQRNLHDTDLPAIVAKHLEKWGGDASWLEIEITESVIASDPTRAVEILARLHAMGVWISIDDFGTGYSSLANLKQMPVDEIKIDKSFVMSMNKNGDDIAIVRSIIELGHNLRLNVVAEGVESQEIYDQLVQLTCDFAQGYHWSRPIPADAFTEWIQEFPGAGVPIPAKQLCREHLRSAGESEILV
jgi:diguanylate cyclase (GGDEF)-like protein/PAS domain S-box-containing protein